MGGSTISRRVSLCVFGEEWPLVYACVREERKVGGGGVPALLTLLFVPTSYKRILPLFF